MQCRLDEEMEEGTVMWYFNDNELTESDNVMLTFDGIYAKLFISK